MNTLTLFSFAPANVWLQVLLLVVSIALVLWGADRLTDGAVALAQRMGIPQIVIGLTIVAMGTSMPEFFVSLMSAINGTPDLAVGNVVGSNIFNALLIVGVAAMVAPITILKSTVRKDVPFAVIASVVLWLMCIDHNISRMDAVVLFVLFIVFMVVTVKGAGTAKATTDPTPTLPQGGGSREQGGEASLKADDSETSEVASPSSLEEGRGGVVEGRSGFSSLLLILVGLVCLVFGSDVFVDNASALARSMGVSDAIIGLTIVAGGTSLPELATSVVAARRGNSGIAIGNVLGSNVFNILMILGITGIIQPMAIKGITNVDLMMMVVSMLLLWLFSFTKLRIQRWEGAVLTLVFVGYMVWLIQGAVA